MRQALFALLLAGHELVDAQRLPFAPGAWRLIQAAA